MDLFAFVILKILLTFSSSLVQVVCKSFLFTNWLQVFLKISSKWFY